MCYSFVFELNFIVDINNEYLRGCVDTFVLLFGELFNGYFIATDTPYFVFHNGKEPEYQLD